MAQHERPFRLTLALEARFHDAIVHAASRQFTRPSEFVRRCVSAELQRSGFVPMEKRPPTPSR